MKCKVLSLTLAIAMIFLLVACGGAGGSSSKDTSSDMQSGSQSSVNTSNSTSSSERLTFKKYDPLITLTENMVVFPSDSFAEGEDIENNIFTKWAMDTMGIVWKPKWVVQDGNADRTQLSLAITSQDLPDLIKVNDLSQLAIMIDSGMVMPVDELIEDNASELVKFLFKEHDDFNEGMMWAPVTVDSKRYAIPFLCDPMGTSSIWYRKDILDTLGKSIPGTLAEMEDVLAAYKAKYPDATPFIMDNILSGMEAVSSTYGAYKGIWMNDGSGSLVYSSIQPQMKQALATMNKWYSNGWIDPEFVAKNGTKAVETFVAGNSLATYGLWSHCMLYMVPTVKNTSSAIVDVGGFLEGPDGKKGGLSPSTIAGWFAVSSKCKNPEAIIYMFNEMMDSAYRNDEELRSKFAFKYDPEPMQDPSNPEVLKGAQDLAKLEANYKQPAPGNGYITFLNRYFLKTYGIVFNQRPNEYVKYHLLIKEEMKESNPNILKALAYQIFTGAIPTVADAHFKNIELILDLAKSGLPVVNLFNGTPTKTMSEKGVYLGKLEQEKFIRIIMGEDPVDSFDDFVKEWKLAGGDQIIIEVNDWYKSVKK